MKIHTKRLLIPDGNPPAEYGQVNVLPNGSSYLIFAGEIPDPAARFTVCRVWENLTLAGQLNLQFVLGNWDLVTPAKLRSHLTRIVTASPLLNLYEIAEDLYTGVHWLRQKLGILPQLESSIRKMTACNAQMLSRLIDWPKYEAQAVTLTTSEFMKVYQLASKLEDRKRWRR